MSSRTKLSPVQRQADRFFALLDRRDALPEGPEYMRAVGTESRMKLRLARLPNLTAADIVAKLRVVATTRAREGRPDSDDEHILDSLLRPDVLASLAA